MEMKAAVIPMTPIALNSSLKIITPMAIVAIRLMTDQIVPTIDN